MIRYLKGKIIFSEVGFCTVLVGGIGYKVECSSFPTNIGDQDSEAEFYIHTHVREDCIRLFGFQKEEELRLFEELLTVSGVGPKAALGIIASNEISQLISDIVLGEIVNYKISGVGKKTLEKVVIDLKTKMGKIDTSDMKNSVKKSGSNKNDNREQAILALQSLGYKNSEIEKIFSSIDDMDKMSLNEIIKEALRIK